MPLDDKLHKIAPSDIEFDKFNPRGETEDQIINDDEFHKLKESISNIGILVPLIVRRNQKQDGKQYVLIDGERRLRASHDLGFATVIARVAANDIEGNIIAYQIHQNRKAWNKPSEAKAIKKIKESILKENPNISETDLKKKLLDATSHKITALNDILKILKYDDETQEKSAKKELDHSYLIRIEDDFIVPLKKVFPEIIDTFGENEIRRKMVRKAELGLLITTRYMMTSSFKTIFKPCIYHDEICSLIAGFIDSPEQSASDLYDNFLELITNKEKDNTNALSSSKSDGILITPPPPLGGSTKPLDLSSPPPTAPGNPDNDDTTYKNNPNYAPIKPKKKSKTDFNAIKVCLESISKSYSPEELEYIKEAVFCLGSEKAHKAAVLMIWSSAISHILSYINKDIPKYNAASVSMNQNKKSFYKYYAGHFQTTATTVDEIREVAKDMQLLCYLCYEKIITTSQFKQLRAYYDTRNSCAHPTDIELIMNETLAIFENLYKFIFNNPKLK